MIQSLTHLWLWWGLKTEKFKSLALILYEFIFFLLFCLAAASKIIWIRTIPTFRGFFFFLEAQMVLDSASPCGTRSSLIGWAAWLSIWIWRLMPYHVSLIAVDLGCLFLQIESLLYADKPTPNQTGLLHTSSLNWTQFTTSCCLGVESPKCGLNEQKVRSLGSWVWTLKPRSQ